MRLPNSATLLVNKGDLEYVPGNVTLRQDTHAVQRVGTTRWTDGQLFDVCRYKVSQGRGRGRFFQCVNIFGITHLPEVVDAYPLL